MTDEQKAAFIFAQSVAALIELEAMKAANIDRFQAGHTLKYSENAFMNLHEHYLIQHNAVIGFFNKE